MLIVNLQDAKARLSELVARAVKGEPFIISKAGKAMVRVEAIDSVDSHGVEDAKSVGNSTCDWGMGSMSGKFITPEDFDTMARDEIAALFSRNS